MAGYVASELNRILSKVRSGFLSQWFLGRATYYNAASRTNLGIRADFTQRPFPSDYGTLAEQDLIVDTPFDRSRLS